jgi:glycine C-acetyltransferase
MWDNAHRLKKGLRNLGYYVGPGQSPICSVYVPHGDADDPDQTAAELVAFLRENGVFVTCVIYPVIPKGLYMFRMIPTSKHEPEHVDRTLEVFERVRQKPGIRVELNDKEIKKVESQYWGLNG